MKTLITYVVGFFLSCSAVTVQAVEYTVTAQGGWAEMKVDEHFSDDITAFSDEGTSLTLGAGLAFASNFTTGLDIAIHKSSSWLGADDRATLSEDRLHLGYKINLSDHFRIVPTLGVSRWKLEFEEGSFEPSSNLKAGTYRDTDVYGQLNLEFPINDLIAIVSSIQYTKYEFGTFRNTQAGVMFQF